MKAVSHRTRSRQSRDDVTTPPPPPPPPPSAGAVFDYDESLEDEFLFRERSVRARSPAKSKRTEKSVRVRSPPRPQPRSRTAADDDDDEEEEEEQPASSSGSESSTESMSAKESSESDSEAETSTRAPIAAKSVGGGRPPTLNRCSASPPLACVARRTRTQAQEQVRVSYSKYFANSDTDGAEDDETDVDSPSLSLDEEMPVNEGADVDSEPASERAVSDSARSDTAKDVESEPASEKAVSDSARSHTAKVVEPKPASKRTDSARSGNAKDVESEAASERAVSDSARSDTAKVVESKPASKSAVSDSARSYTAKDIKSERASERVVLDSADDDSPVHVLSNSVATSASLSSGPAQRTCSRYSSSSSEKWKKLGTVSSPLCLNEDDPEPKREVEEADSRCLYGADRVKNPNGRAEETSKKRKRARPGSCGVGDLIDLDDTDTANGGKGGANKGRVQAGPSSKRRKGPQLLKADEVFNILRDTIWDGDKKLPDELTKEKSPVSGGGSEPQAEDLLPLTFSFGDEKPKPLEKTEEDELWEDYDFVLNATMIGTSYHDDEDQTDEISKLNMDSDPSTSCGKGNHQLFLDEQIGIRCRFCSFIRVHIRDIMPSWAPHFGERSARKTTFNEDEPFAFNDLHSTVIGGGQGSFIPPTGTIWALPGINTSMFPHQREAIEFMWRNLAGSINIDELKSGVGSDGSGGCVISHAPGTGKTRTAILFIQTYMKVFPECRPVIFAPSVMLLGWVKEFKKWGVDLAVHNLSDHELSREEEDAVFKLVPKGYRDPKLTRMVKLHLWHKGNSVILITYALFTKIVTSEGNHKDAHLKKIMLEKSGLIIFDEGHTPRNDNSASFKALKELQTSKRVILTGTPFQNNFKELYNTLWLVRPMFAESKIPILSQDARTRLFGGKEDGRFWEKNEVRDSWATLTKNITDDRSIPDDKTVEELKTIIEPFVHVYNGKILDSLPGSQECVIVLDPVPLQHKNTLEKLQRVKCTPGLENNYRISLAAIHPFLVTFYSLSDEEKTLLDSQSLEKLRLNPEDGVKTKFVIELIRLSDSLKEKVLVFCHNLEPLDMLKDQLVKLFNWTENVEVLKMVGKDNLKRRQSSIDVFNDLSSEARVMLASTKACAEGISLVGASRVVLLDVEWNPSVEFQAISRAYRLGQTKFVYIYHLITYGTGEADKYSKQTKKDLWSKLVFSPEIDFNNIKASPTRNEEEQTCKFVAEDKILEEMTGNEKLKDMFLKICYQPKESNIRHVFTTDDQNPIGNGHRTG